MSDETLDALGDNKHICSRCAAAAHVRRISTRSADLQVRRAGRPEGIAPLANSVASTKVKRRPAMD